MKNYLLNSLFVALVIGLIWLISQLLFINYQQKQLITKQQAIIECFQKVDSIYYESIIDNIKVAKVEENDATDK